MTFTWPTTPVADDTPDLARIEAELIGLVHAAKRCIPVVGTPEFRTPWDRAHAEIDRLLDQHALVASFVADEGLV